MRTLGPFPGAGRDPDHLHTREKDLDNDKAFAAFALFLIAGVATLLSTLVLTGPGTWPSPLVVGEHVALGLSMRAAYKWIGGWNWADWSVTSEHAPARAAADEVFAAPGATADAMG